ncbi:putative Haloacid dehalogenase-like hydrolase domain-containing protein [Nannochloris sp. 'desiccata']|nr:putative Haloacid dehalogenase-like hydrolase domain-containing protein [Chlorella desiccata (nom. nud.)]
MLALGSHFQRTAAVLLRRSVATNATMSHTGSVNATSNSNPPLRVIRGVVFDMDGTLTVPCIDFAEMRRRAGVTEGDILTVIDAWPAERRAKAYAAIAEIEAEALQNMKIMPGAVVLCSLLDASHVPRALVTRNVSSSVDFFHRTHFDLPPFFPALSREWTPYKPDPGSLLHIAEHWGVKGTELVMIGDSAKDDVVCANRAGAVSILLDIDNTYTGLEDPKLAGELKPTFIVSSLNEAAEVLHTKVQLSPARYPEAAAAGEDASH